MFLPALPGMCTRHCSLSRRFLLPARCPAKIDISCRFSSYLTTVSRSGRHARSDIHQSLRCPRCDSSNTKFCYYNNYNLTQPRHFCKTCRRYWTQGGALRNVPIGGGCRKNKNTSVPTTTGKSSSGKVKTVSSDIGQSSLESGYHDHELPSNPILWASPQNSQLLALLRSTQFTNPNSIPISNSVTVKDEMPMIGSHMMSESAVASSALNARTLSLQDHLSQGEVQNTGIQELFQRLRSSPNYYTNHSPALLTNVASSSTSSSSILESAPIAGGELGYWNPAFSWSDLPTTNGAYP
ncbi:hypothetical protein HHK36_010021 [Tetracentron sinense]|uniref:Dof zinc finger protein n=1 Tax=Tetracentron sinense TaxID=13715 RepID=A0A835DI31_TETSI|nr:hypothetical protein HHK36_010021 [Tetracentron sinense]